LHACVEGGHVQVTLKRDGDFANITIEDDGPGIPPDQVKRVFDPFFSTKKGGTGLGLPIVKTTLDRHGGSITIGRSDELGGASITVRLPLDPGRRAV
jgi:signal transduction histidine kinase